MAAPPLLLLHFLFCFFSILHILHAQIQIPHLPSSVFLPVNRDPATLQYITQIHHGLQLKSTNLVVDVSAPFVSINCASSRRLIPGCSIQCSMAKPFHLGAKKSCFSVKPPSSCDLSVQNGITRLATKGELAEDAIAVRSKSGKKLTQIADFVFACAAPALLNGLASGVQGILGLGRSPIAFPSQIAAKFELNYNKFATCLSSSNGFISFGIMGTNPILSSLTYTNLVRDPDSNSQDYFINVKSIKISDKRMPLRLDEIGRTRISTVVPYTTLESTIYGVFKKGYTKAASFMNMTRVAPVAPFDICFSSKRIAATIVPAIDLVLQSEMVKWRIYGSNSMVKLSEEVMCLGILDGGLDPKTSTVIGGFQLEDILLEFDLGTNMLGFSLPLSMRQASCSDFMVESVVEESL